MTFKGFPAEGLTFYEGLEADNSRDYWHANKPVYERAVKGPMLALLDAVPDRYKPFHLFRPNRDVRFSSDKSPYKTATGALGEGEGGSQFYVQFSAQGLLVAAGYYAMASDQLERFRAAVDADNTGADIERRVATLVKKGYTAGAIDELKSAPRGYKKDHPRIELLRRKGLMVSKTYAPAAWMHTAACKKKVEDTWAGAATVCEWLDAHVGPSTLPPDDRWVR